MPPAELKRIEQAKRLRADQGEQLAAGMGISPCHLLQVRGRYRGCEEAMEDLGEAE